MKVPALKEGVILLGLKPELLMGIFLIWDLVTDYSNGKSPVITSVTDGKHKRSSEHYQGYACDWRIWHIADPESCTLAMRNRLGENFVVLLEKDHIHMHFKGAPIVPL